MNLYEDAILVIYSELDINIGTIFEDCTTTPIHNLTYDDDPVNNIYRVELLSDNVFEDESEFYCDKFRIVSKDTVETFKFTDEEVERYIYSHIGLGDSVDASEVWNDFIDMEFEEFEKKFNSLLLL
jgi:hypothetical protein